MNHAQATMKHQIMENALRASEGDYREALHHLAEQLVLITSTSVEDRNRAKRAIRTLKTGI